MPLVPNNTVKEQKEKKQIISFEITNPKYSFENLILSDKVADELQTIVKSKECWDKVFIQWNLASVMKQQKGMFINLYGDPGTGKTMAAHAVSHALDKKMICVNYSDIESKYVGETSKNLSSLFKYAKENDVIIFFDEADALLSKRVTNMSSSTDVSVNQTRSVLLTLLNDFEGMVIFATNFISNYDSAFMRRIQYHIKFELPNEELRRKLWRMYIPFEMPAQININEISEKYSNISGSDISNAVLKAALKAAKNNEDFIKQDYFEEAISDIIQSKEANKNSTSESCVTRKISEEEVPENIRKKVNV